jgi:hypothetical protein
MEEFRKIKELLHMINVTGHNNEYDWNADHSEITLLEGEIHNLLNGIEKEFKEVQVTHSPTYPMWQEAVDTITALESKLKAAEEKAANSVPFEVMCPHCDMPACERTPDNCPLIPKGESEDDKEELEYMRKLAYSIEHDTMPPER